MAFNISFILELKEIEKKNKILISQVILTGNKDSLQKDSNFLVIKSKPAKIQRDCKSHKIK